MVDFSSAQVGGPQGSPVSVQAPVTGPSLAGPLNTISSVFQQKEVNDKAKRVAAAGAAEEGAVGRFVSEMSVLADAVDSGNMPPAEAAGRARATLNKALANNPQNSKAILSASNSFTSSGLGKVITEGNFQVQMERDLITDAAQAGYVQPYMDEAQTEEGVAKHQALLAFQASQEAKRDAVALESSQIALEEAKAGQKLRIGRVGAAETKFQAGVTSATANARTAQLNLSKAQRAQEQANTKKQQHGAVAEFADLSYFSIRGQINQVYQDISGGKVAPEVGEQRLLSLKADTGQVVTQLGRGLDKAVVDHLSSPVNQLLDTAIKNVSSDNRTKLLEDAVKRTKAISVSNAVSQDPELAKLWSLTSMLGPNNSAIIEATGPVATRFLNNNGEPTGSPANLTEDQPEGTDAVTSYLEFVKGGMVKLKQAKPDDGKPADPAEVAAHVNNVLAGTTKYDGSVSNLTEIKRTIDYYASPEFAEYMFENKGHVDPNVLNAAASVVVKRIKDELAPAVKADFTKAMASDGSDPFARTTVGVGAGDVELEVRGNQVLFVGQPQKPGNVLEVFRDPEAIAETLNKQYSAALTKTIMAEANLSGQTFAETFEQLKPFMVPEESVAPPTQEEAIESSVAELMADPDIIEAGLTEEQVRAAVVGEVQ